MSLRQRKAELTRQHLQLAGDYAQLTELRGRFRERAWMYNALISDIAKRLTVVEARLTIIEINTRKPILVGTIEEAFTIEPERHG
jgi:hypothetical protein